MNKPKPDESARAFGAIVDYMLLPVLVTTLKVGDTVKIPFPTEEHLTAFLVGQGLRRGHYASSLTLEGTVSKNYGPAVAASSSDLDLIADRAQSIPVLYSDGDGLAVNLKTKSGRPSSQGVTISPDRLVGEDPLIIWTGRHPNELTGFDGAPVEKFLTVLEYIVKAVGPDEFQITYWTSVFNKARCVSKSRDVDELSSQLNAANTKLEQFASKTILKKSATKMSSLLQRWIVSAHSSTR